MQFLTGRVGEEMNLPPRVWKGEDKSQFFLREELALIFLETMEELVDKFKRRIDYLRLSVTDRCNLRCIYCMPQDGILQKEPSQILTFEETSEVIRLAISAGINKIKVTGGEPLVRKDLTQLLESLSSLPGLRDLSLTTNGILLAKYAPGLKRAGLKRINISIDSLSEQKFQRITRGGLLLDVLNGIDAALKEVFFIKLNVVIMKGINDDEILDFVQFGQERKVIVRFIEFMSISENSISGQDLYISSDEIKERLGVLGRIRPVENNGFGSGPAQYYKIEDTSVIIGFISPISCKFCFSCSRLRLTADGLLRPCLVSEEAFDLKEPLRQNDDSKVLDLIKKAAIYKPQGHSIGVSGQSQSIIMSRIGG